MPPPKTLPNPAAQLASVVSRLYDLAANSQTPPDQQRALRLQAHDLRGDLVSLVAIQFSRATPAYKNVMASLTKVTGALNQAQQDIQKAIKVVKGAGALAKSIDSLIKEAVKISAVI